MSDLPEFIEDAESRPDATDAEPGPSRRIALLVGAERVSVEVCWPGPEGGFGPTALAGLHLAAPDPRRQSPVCMVPMQDERVRGALRGEIYVVQDSPERQHFLLWVAVPAWRTADDRARLIPAGVVRHEALTRVLRGAWPEGPPEPRVIATGALIAAHAIQRMARQGPAAAEGWELAEGWPRGINLQEVVTAAREGRPVEVGVLPRG